MARHQARRENNPLTAPATSLPAPRVDADRRDDGRFVTFFDAAVEAHGRAVSAAGCDAERNYRIGERSITLRFAGNGMSGRLSAALSHLSCYPGTEDPLPDRAPLKVLLFDTESTGIRMPPPPWRKNDYLAHGLIRGSDRGRYRVSFSLDSGLLSMLDLHRDLALCWTAAPDRLPDYEAGAPLRAILHWWMRERGIQMIHAGAVGTAAGGVLLVGKGGSGKSTTAVACHHAGMRYLSDDYCLVATSPGPTAFGLYRSAKLNLDSLSRFPSLAGKPRSTDPPAGEKMLLFLEGKLEAKLPLRAIVIPRISGEPCSRLRPASATEALAALAPSTMFQLAGPTEVDFRHLGALVRSVAAFRLELGTDAAQSVALIRMLSDGVFP